MNERKCFNLENSHLPSPAENTCAACSCINLMEALGSIPGVREVSGPSQERTQRFYPAFKSLLVSPWRAQGQLTVFGFAGDLRMCWGQRGQRCKALSTLWVWVLVLSRGQPGRGIEHPGLVGGLPTHCREMEQAALAGPFKLKLFWDCVTGPLCQRVEEKNRGNGSALLRKLWLMVARQHPKAWRWMNWICATCPPAAAYTSEEGRTSATRCFFFPTCATFIEHPKNLPFFRI